MFGGLEPKQKNVKAFNKGVTVVFFVSVFLSTVAPLLKYLRVRFLARIKTKRDSTDHEFFLMFSPFLWSGGYT